MEKREPDISEQNPHHDPQQGTWLDQLEANRAAERRVLEELARDSLREQRRTRRSKSLFRFFIMLYLIFLSWMSFRGDWSNVELKSLSPKESGHSAVITINGVISPETPNSAQNVMEGLQNAFKNPDTKGVIIRINSPGGSPVQAGQIYDEILRLRAQYPKMPVFAALEDLCASGGYYVAAAIPKIYADKATLVGSIGVIMQGFGVQETMNKLGVENRLLTAGKNKAFLSPFVPLDPEEKQHALGLLNKIHEQFIGAVKKGRGNQLKSGKGDVFQGLIWTGEDAVAMGLIDGLGSAQWIARDLIKAEKMVDFTVEKDWLNRLGKRLGAVFRNQVLMQSGWSWL